MKFHYKKILPEYFEPLVKGRKPFEIRLNDEDYQEGDYVELMEYDGIDYTGAISLIRIKEIFPLDKIGLKNYIAFTFTFESFAK